MKKEEAKAFCIKQKNCYGCQYDGENGCSIMELEKLYTPFQALNNIRAKYFENKHGEDLEYFFFERVENALKALEIIKDKKVDVFSLICCIQLNEYTALETYNLKENCHNYFLTGDEYNLLKEVLKHE